MLADEIVVRYLRDQLLPEPVLLRRIALAFRVGVLRSYAARYGRDTATTVVRVIQIAALVLLFLGMLMVAMETRRGIGP
ncbi:MAG TPA: hypothetical protein VEH50_00260 [Methylomirabilota bacterium]|jgi:hypothetical protein|nr:hypothetical protein [Methylomirabilota bacterium]